MLLKELQAAFLREYTGVGYFNYLIAELPDGSVSIICHCDGHATMEEAMICHDTADKLNVVRAVLMDGHELPVHNVITKTTTTVEFLEE